MRRPAAGTKGTAPEPKDQEGPRPSRRVRKEAPPQRPDGPSTFVIAKTATCVWCEKTLDFLRALHEQRGDFQVAVVDAADQPDAFRQMTAYTRRTTVPQIFLDGRFLGGWSELAAAAKSGELDAYLDRADGDGVK